jgi:hypothetical protein
MKISLKKLASLILSGCLIVLAACNAAQNTAKATEAPSVQTLSTPDAATFAPISQANGDFALPTILCRPTGSSIVVNVVPAAKMDLYVEYGTTSGSYGSKTAQQSAAAGTPMEIALTGLSSNTRYYYRLEYKKQGAGTFITTSENSFSTARTKGSTYTFCVQADSHPERSKNMYDPSLYMINMQNVVSEQPDFFLSLGDDFSVDTMNTITQPAVQQLYVNQRNYMGLVGASAPVFLVNGNHEQAAQYVLDGTPNNTAIWGQNARNLYFSQPAPDRFYTGDLQNVSNIGLLRDYYAFTWGDALFITLDPYWHSPVPVDNALGGGAKRSDMWEITLGDAQYNWFQNTLKNSTAKYKFVFTHHVLGTGRGGIDIANGYEWGGYGKDGKWAFAQKRPGWALPIQQVMAKYGVTIFFQGHDHIFAKEEKDGVIYQTLPNPADPNYALNNADAFSTAVKYPGSGHLRVTVSPQAVKVDYISSVMPKDVSSTHKNGQTIYSYTVQ